MARAFGSAALTDEQAFTRERDRAGRNIRADHARATLSCADEERARAAERIDNGVSRSDARHARENSAQFVRLLRRIATLRIRTDCSHRNQVGADKPPRRWQAPDEDVFDAMAQ